MSRKMLATHVRTGEIVRVCHGVYASSSPPDVVGHGSRRSSHDGWACLVACMGTAAALHGFATER